LSQFSRETRPQTAFAVVNSSLNGAQIKMSRKCIICGALNEACCFMASSHGTAGGWMLALSQPARSFGAYRQDKAMQKATTLLCPGGNRYVN
jgi:hypothetical protein